MYARNVIKPDANKQKVTNLELIGVSGSKSSSLSNSDAGRIPVRFSTRSRNLLWVTDAALYRFFIVLHHY